MKRTPKKKF